MEYSNQDQQLSESFYYRPHQQHPHFAQAPAQSYNPSTTKRPSPPLTDVPLMPAHGSYPSSHGSGSYEAQLQAHRTGEASSSRGTVSPGEGHSGLNGKASKRTGGKANVSSACGPCKKAHLACDIQRPCKRCTNMGKEDQCEDVPHKKRGRPKVNKSTTTVSHPRARPSHEPMPQYRQPVNAYLEAPPGNYDPSYHPHQEYRAYYQNAPPPPQARIPSPQMPGSDPPNLCTMFTTTDFRIMRVTHGSWNLTGYQEPDFVGHSMMDWVNPADRLLLDEERLRLLTINNTMLPNSKWEILSNLARQLSERELVSPAEGMGDQYPNQNVRLVRADQQYNLFNVRLHLGGGLGGSLYRPDTYERLYLVVSCLLIPPQPSVPHSRAVSSGTVSSSYGPPTPITPMTAGPPSGPPGGLPGFSSIAAGVEAPPPPVQNARYPSGTYSPYLASRPGSQHQQTPAGLGPYTRPPSTQPIMNYPPQVTPSNIYAKSPSQEIQTPYTPYEYSQRQSHGASQPPQTDQTYYPEYREDQWNRHAGDGNPPPLQQLPPDTSSSSSSNPSIPPNDFSRRPWES